MFSIQGKSAEEKKTKRSMTPPPAAYGGFRALRTALKGTGIDHTTNRDDSLAGENRGIGKIDHKEVGAATSVGRGGWTALLHPTARPTAKANEV
jgi:hypothetical protein